MQKIITCTNLIITKIWIDFKKEYNSKYAPELFSHLFLYEWLSVNMFPEAFEISVGKWGCVRTSRENEVKNDSKLLCQNDKKIRQSSSSE